MSTAVFPQNMRPYGSSGYTHHSTLLSFQYVPWKGSGINANPVALSSGHIRPLTNRDPGNVFLTGFGLPRPLKHYRKGRLVPGPPGANERIDANLYRFVRSSTNTALGGGNGRPSDILDLPGSVVVLANGTREYGCSALPLTTSYSPNKGYLTENPEPTTCNPVWCCNPERKARRRAIYASTNLSKAYYSTHAQYLQNRCLTYDQKAFNFRSIRTNEDAAPGTFPTYTTSSTGDVYFAQCQPNQLLYEGRQSALVVQMLDTMVTANALTSEQQTAFVHTGINSVEGFHTWLCAQPNNDAALRIFSAMISAPDISSTLFSGHGCARTIYKPNNPSFAQEGAVASSTQLLQTQVDTLSRNPAKANAYTKNNGVKAVACAAAYPLNMQPPFQNKRICLRANPLWLTTPSTYRYFPSTYTSTNHFSMTPRNPLM